MMDRYEDGCRRGELLGDIHVHAQSRGPVFESSDFSNTLAVAKRGKSHKSRECRQELHVVDIPSTLSDEKDSRPVNFAVQRISFHSRRTTSR